MQTGETMTFFNIEEASFGFNCGSNYYANLEITACDPIADNIQNLMLASRVVVLTVDEYEELVDKAISWERFQRLIK